MAEDPKKAEDAEGFAPASPSKGRTKADAATGGASPTPLAPRSLLPEVLDDDELEDLFNDMPI